MSRRQANEIHVATSVANHSTHRIIGQDKANEFFGCSGSCATSRKHCDSLEFAFASD